MMLRSLALLALAGVMATACDYPTELPSWDQTWVVPGPTIEIGVAEFLPTGVSLDSENTVFVAEAGGTSIAMSLGDMCDGCSQLDGTTAPKPAFEASLSAATTLPDDLVAAVLTGGTIAVTMEHSLNFDPLRPDDDPGAERGHIGVTVRSAGTVVADTLIHGDDQAFPAGTPLTPTLAIRPVHVVNDLDLEVRLYSPTGDPVMIESSDTLGVTFAPATLEIEEATVRASSVAVGPTRTEADFGDAGSDEALLDRIESGAIRLRISNPFAVTGQLDITFEAEGTTVARTVEIGPGDSSARVELSGDELRSILASETATVVTSGTVSATDGTVTVTPTQVLVLEHDFELVLRVGGSAEAG